MLNITAAEPWASEALWAWSCARRAVCDAIGALEDAGAALQPLIDDSEWHAEGVRALHELIVELRARTVSEIDELRSTLWEIDAVAAS